MRKDVSQSFNRQIEGRPQQQFVLNKLSVARICSAIGGAALVLAVLLLMGQHEVTLPVILSMISAIIGISLWTVLAPDDLRNLVSGRQARYGSNSVLASILVIGIVAVVYGLVNGTGIAADMTSVGFYSIKDYIRPIIDKLDQPIIITAFYNTSRINDQAADAPVLQMFSDTAPTKIKVQVIDPDEQPAVAQKFGLNSSFGIYVSPVDATGQPDTKNTIQMQGPYANERWIAQAIAQLEAKGKYKVLFSVGHSELDTSSDQGDAYLIRQEMQDAGINTDTLDLRNAPIPPDTSALVLLRPADDFRQDEVDKIAAYLAKGGKLIVMAEPAFTGAINFMVPADSPMAKYLWETWGLRPQNDIVYDPKSAVGDPYRILAAQSASDFPITRKDATTQVRPLFSIAQSWEVNKNAPQDLQITPLFLSSDQSYGKTNVQAVASNPHPETLKQEPGDLTGPLVLAAAAKNTTTNGQIIVVGDADWVMNEVITSFDGNDLWRNMIDWLTQYLTQITVQPQIEQLPLITTTGNLNVALWVTLVILPGLVLITGAVVMWNRLRH